MIGARQIGFTVMSISISLVAVFIPLIFMGGIMGRLFHEFAMTLTLAIAISAVVSLTLTPMMCGRFMHGDARRSAARRVGRGSKRRSMLLAPCTGSMPQPRLGAAASRVHAAGHRATIVLTVQLYTVVPKGFLPVQDTGILMGSTVADRRTSPSRPWRTGSARRWTWCWRDPAVASVGSTIGVSTGWNSMNRGNLTVSLKPLGERGSLVRAGDRATAPRLTKVGGMQTFLFAAQDLRGGGRQGGAQYQYVLIGQDLQRAASLGVQLEDAAEATTPGSPMSPPTRIAPGRRSNVVIDRDAAARLGVSRSAIDNALNNAYSQRQISTIYTAAQSVQGRAGDRSGAAGRSVAARPDLRRLGNGHAGAAVARWLGSSAAPRRWRCAIRASIRPRRSVSTSHPASPWATR